MFSVIMIKVMNSDGVACDEFPYILLTLSTSLSLNPFLCPICAVGSCSINRHLHFSYLLGNTNKVAVMQNNL